MESEAIPDEKPASDDRPGHLRRSSISWLLAGALVLAGAAALGVARHAKRVRPPVRASAPLTASCASSVLAPPTAPSSLGSWRFHLLYKGTFDSVTTGPQASLLGLEACGREESSLRVVELFPGGQHELASAGYRGAPLVSSVAARNGAIFFGEATLALTGAGGEPPYELELVELDRRLHQIATISLGRGWGARLFPATGGELVVSTGERLLALSRQGRLRQLASFPGQIIQQLSVLPRSKVALLSLFDPGAGEASSTTLELVGLESGSLLSRLELPGGEEVESLYAGASDALVAVASGGTSSLERLSDSPGLRELAPDRGLRSESLSSTALLASHGELIAASLAGLSCLSSVSGKSLAAATSSPALPSAIATLGEKSFVTIPAGIGRLATPPRCGG